MTSNDPFDRVLAGVAEFQRDVFPGRRALFARLAERQDPKVLFLTCSDSRINPNLITGSEPGELFICRNIGNVVPPHGTADGGVATVMEYAVDVLRVAHLIVCGHSGCGAIKSLLDPADDHLVPRVTEWLRFAQAAPRLANLTTAAGDRGGPAYLEAVTKQNVIAQMANLRTYPEVAAQVAAGHLTLHGWYYDIGSGNVEAVDGAGRFAPVAERYGAAGAETRMAKPE